MKRLIALLLVLMMTFSMTACGDDSGSGTQSGGSDTGKSSDSGKSTGDYKTFDDLDYEWDVCSDYLYFIDEVEGELYLRCDVPHDFAVEPSYQGFYIFDSELGAIVISSGEYNIDGITVDEAFEAVYSEYFIRTLGDYASHRASMFAEFTPDSTEKLTVNGRDTIKFSGTQVVDDYGTEYRYMIYGYCTVIENVPVIIAAVAGDPDLDYNKSTQSSDNMASINHYTDEMIYNLRALDHYEEYGDNK